jgi:hypothetical protein
MVFSDALEVAIGLSFILLLVSLLMTATVETIESVLRTRGSHLLEGITELLGDPAQAGSGQAAAHALYTHPLLQGLFKGSIANAAQDRRLPSYVPSRNFALALIDQVLAGRLNPAAAGAGTSIPAPAHASLGDRLRLAAERIDNPQLRRALLQSVEVAGDDLERVTKHLVDWYDTAMDRVSGRFKRRSQHWLLWLGLATALLLNINTLTIADSLSKNATLRRAVVVQAEVQARAASAPTTATLNPADEIRKLGLPIGWSQSAVDDLLRPMQCCARTQRALAMLQIGLGYLLTALAITLGAPFWFDALNRLMVIRATVKPREKSPEEPSQDAPAPGHVVKVVVPVAAEHANDKDATRPAQRQVDSDIYATPPGPNEKPFEE